MEKYEDNGLPTFGKIPEEDIEKAAKVYGEGYEPLINCLKICWQSNIQTFGCCSGHEKEDEETHEKRIIGGYIACIVEDEDMFNYIIGKMINARGLSQITLQSSAEYEQLKKIQIKGKTEITFSCNYEDRESFFNELSNCIKQYGREKDYEVKGKKCLNEIMELFMNRTFDGLIQVNYLKDGHYELSINNNTTYLTEEEMKNNMLLLVMQTRPKSKVIETVISMCEEIGLLRILDVGRRLGTRLRTGNTERGLDEDESKGER